MNIDYELKLEIFYRQVIKSGNTVVDIGAHSGRHSNVFAFLVGLDGKVIAFEPNPNIIKLLKTRCKYWIDNRVLEIKQFATSNEDTETTFIIANDRPEESGLTIRKYNGPTTTSMIDVKVTKVDSFINEFEDIKFIKIDTEGAEFNTLLGAKSIIEKFRPIIAFEFGESSYKAYSVNPSEVFDYLTNFDYQIYSIDGLLLDKKNFIDESKIQKFWDYITCHKNDVSLVESIFKDSRDINEIQEKINSLYKSILKREADNEGLLYYSQKLIENSVNIAEIESILKSSNEYKEMNK